MYEIKSSYQCCIICAATVNTGHIVKPPVHVSGTDIAATIYTQIFFFFYIDIEIPNGIFLVLCHHLGKRILGHHSGPREGETR